ncbi:MAG: DUF1311 domain-containing protein [Hyphomonadaceae bacterium]|nr:DUF1311 domain-containing protein [Hyphomonadaceae bacterium]
MFSAQTDDAVAACREATSRPCIEDDGGTTPGLIECYSAENDGWEHVMDFVAGELTAAFPESAALLADAQHNWQLFREQDCAFAQQRWGPGSGAQVEYVRCMATHAADRAVALVLVQRHPD